MKTSELPSEVWIGEAYNTAGERVERVVHLTEEDAHTDIRVLADTSNEDIDHIRVEREQLLTGQVADTSELAVVSDE